MSKIAYIEDIQTWSEEFTYFEEISIRFSETDMYGHLNNIVPFIYFEQVRTQYFAKTNFLHHWSNPEDEAIVVVANIQCDYLKQVYFGETIRVYVKVNSIGNSSVDLHYMAKNQKGEITFVGRGTMVQVSGKTGKSLPWTEKEKVLLERKEQL